MRAETKKRISGLLWEEEMKEPFSFYDGVEFDEAEQCFRYYDDVRAELTGYVSVKELHKAVKQIWNELNEEEQKHFTAELLSGREV